MNKTELTKIEMLRTGSPRKALLLLCVADLTPSRILWSPMSPLPL